MPTISMFYGILIQMYFYDDKRPHVHIWDLTPEKCKHATEAPAGMEIKRGRGLRGRGHTI